MKTLAIQAKNLSKTYWSNTESGETKKIPVFSDVNFDIQRGEVIGVLGANGSGKSTLLKIIAGITKPNEGQVEVWGSIASLLDIGAGFHPELSGLENIVLMGQLQGISKKISEQFISDIIAFSEIGDFIHLPVKNYSKGMYLRLAFSTMIHLPFDIYLMDEVLSVGDRDFQEKCRNYLHQLAMQKDKTLLLISHNFSELRELCTGYMTFHSGKLLRFEHLDAYFRFQSQQMKPVENGTYQLWEHGMNGQHSFEAVKVEIGNKSVFDFHEEIPVQIVITALNQSIQMGISVRDAFNQTVFQTYFKEELACSSQIQIEMNLPSHFFNQGEFQIDLLFYKNGQLHRLSTGLAKFELQEIRFDHTLPIRTWGPTKPMIHIKSIAYAD